MSQRSLPLVLVLALGFTSLTAVAVLGALALGLIGASRSTDALLRERARATLSSVVEHLLSHVDPVVHQVAAMGQAIEAGQVDPADPAQFRLFALGALAGLPQVGSIAWVRPDLSQVTVTAASPSGEIGAMRASATDLPDAAASLAWGRSADGPRWIPPLWSPSLGRAVVALEMPVRRGNDFLGLLVPTVSLQELSRRLGEMAIEGQTPFILYGRDQVVAHARGLAARDRLPRLGEIGDPVLARIWDPVPPGDVTFAVHEIDAGTERKWQIGTWYHGNLGAEEVARLQLMAAGGAVILLIAVGLTLVVGRRLTRPVARLAEAADQIETDAFGRFTELPGSRVRELDQAQRAFNHMVAGLKERQRIRDLFGKYVPNEVVSRLIAEPNRIGLGGEKREISLLFSDIAGFTTLAEGLPADAVLRLLNGYFEEIVRIVSAEQGIIVDFIGDAVFAIFGTPIEVEDHAARALAATRAIQAFTRRFATEQQARGIPMGATRIGVHTGPATVGNFGSSDRLKYGAAGDVVNTCSRLEGANKAFGTLVLASAEVVRRAGDPATRTVGRIVLKGRTMPIEVHELLDRRQPDYDAAYQLLEAGSPAALDAFRRLPEDGLVRFHLDRLAEGIVSPVIELKEK